ncbi:integrator complex subunit 3 homolog isoform X2 [Bicyclus anynana]|uniref:Integrator complex subunit 3 homolog isoform X2 n=1 Tax=Bicyclus anynana TaxID=110368 RepID=A0A6J1P4R4_BICAN|nr:integrator complex subunit 3 homolog isoform X2 [Bicyclus anynana]
MMQQPVYQQEQQGAQDQQQMVLCPVRLVYETQMLVQPGDQIQPNQTILINHQNTPPWIQNRQVQNPVFYVQHVPTNYMPSPQQHIDQNQLYIQNYGYQNVPQMFVQNPQEQIRPLQMMPSVMPNIQTLPTNIAAMQNPRMVSNVAAIPQQVNILNAQNQNNSTLNINRMITPNQINPNEIISKPQEIVQNIYRHQMPQTVQQEPRFPIQPTITMVPNNVQNIQRVPQTFDSTVNQIRPMQQNAATNIQQAYPNTIFNVEESRKVNTTANKGTSATNFNVVNPVPAAKSMPQSYRPIQPRTNQVRSNAPNLLPMQPSTTIQAQHTMPNIISMNSVPRKTTTFSNIKVEGNSYVLNRKRKSESPDEVHKKVTISNQTEAPITIKQIQNEYSASSADVGCNTSPVHRPSGRITINSMQITPLNPLQNSKIIEELAKPIRTSTQVSQNTQMTQNIQVTQNTQEAQNVVRNMINIIPETVNETQVTEKEKLVRNTVYVQARGRILTDKDSVPEPPKTETVVSKPEPSLSLPIIDPPVEIKINTPEKSIILQVTNEKQSDTSKDKLEIKKEIIKKITEVKKELLSPVAKTSAQLEDVTSKVKVEIKNEKKGSASIESPKEVNKIKTESKPDVKVKAETSKEVKEDRGYILTHVLGGFVIQESNIAFPIRKPLKERTFYNNSDEMKKENKDVKREREFVKDNSKILDISHLNIKECENMEGEVTATATDDSEDLEEDENPFKLLTPSSVRTWTAEQLAAHLAKYNWNETVSVLQDHELDGESLSLVSKAQLVTIGVKEEHAEIICEFVKS